MSGLQNLADSNDTLFLSRESVIKSLHLLNSIVIQFNERYLIIINMKIKSTTNKVKKLIKMTTGITIKP